MPSRALARPTPRGAALAAAGLTALIAARGLGTAALAPLGIGFLVVVAGALVLTTVAARGTHATRVVEPARPRAGERVEARIAMAGAGPGRWALRALEWDVDAGLGALGQARVTRAAGVMRIGVASARRGDHELPPLRLRVGDVFGLAVGSRTYGAATRLLVVPETLPAADTTAALGGRDRGRLAPTGEDVSSLEGLREYRQGDPLSRVHWGQSAKRGRLHTKVFRPEEGGGRVAVVLLDCAAQSRAGEADRELAVTAAASVARSVATGSGRAGGVSVWLSHEPAARESGWAEAESRFARVRPQAAAPALDVVLHRAARLLHPGSGLVAVTADPPEALGDAARACRRAGVDLVVVLVGEHAAGAPALPGVPTARAANRDALRTVLAPPQRGRRLARA